MAKNKFIAYVIFALLTLLSVSGFFLLGFERTTLALFGLIFLIISYFMCLFASIFLIKNGSVQDKVFSISGIGALIFIYQIAVFISIAFCYLINISLGKLIFIEILLNVIFFVIFMIIVFTSASIQKNNEKIRKNLEEGNYDTPKRGGF